MGSHTNAPDNPPPTLHELEDGWTIHITFALTNVAVMTLVRPDGLDAHIEFVTSSGGGGEPITVTELSEIQDTALRTAADAMLAAYAARVANANKSVAEFNKLVPPTRLKVVFDWLAERHTAASLAIDSDRLAVGLKLTASGEAAGVLLTLLGRWRESPDVSADEITTDLDEFELETHLPQDGAVRFLMWLHEAEVGD
jgi:hypothetical protein